uniref:heat shock factor 2-binding protein n=1 Tax=Panthera onca TaxID=9690 RepID=UPI002955D55C|nr:heat shock factor 2-binding protein [Panthera onca]
MGEAGGAEEASRQVGSKEEFVKVRKKDLERLTTEVMQIRDFLPRILNGEVLESFQKLKIVEKNLERREQDLERLRMDCEHFKARLETVQADGMRDKKVRCSRATAFFFYLSVADVAAIACGREFLVNSSRVLLDTFLQLLGDLKPGQCTKLKVLLLMSLYNVSINLKGLKYISESPGFIPLLWWLLSDPDAEVCLHALRLVQSVVLEPEVFSKSASEFRSSLPLQRILAMAKSRNPHLQTVAQELLEDLRALERDV